jgi:hypothetical protein
MSRTCVSIVGPAWKMNRCAKYSNGVQITTPRAAYASTTPTGSPRTASASMIAITGM